MMRVSWCLAARERGAWGDLHLGRTNFPEGSVDDPVDKRAAAASEAYGGYQTRAQLLALGISSRQIASRVKRGWLFPEYWRVYAVGHRPVLPVDRAHGALLAAGPESALSHRSAGIVVGAGQGLAASPSKSQRSRTAA